MDAIYDFARNVVQTRFEDLSTEVIGAAKKLILDGLATALAGSGLSSCKKSVNMTKGWGGREESSILVYGGKVPAFEAAFVNSMMVHALDFDDTHDVSLVHSNSFALPTAMAVSEAQTPFVNISGKTFLVAYILGVDMANRMSLAGEDRIGWTASSAYGGFASAAIAGKILGLSEEETRNALGIVLSHTAGSTQTFLEATSTKRMQPGFLARAGIFSAYLARNGVTGVKDVLEGTYGFYPLYKNSKYDRNVLIDELGKRFEIVNVSLKNYPSCRATSGAIDAAIDIRNKEKIIPNHIKEITVYVSEMVNHLVGKPFEIRDNPQVDAMFSIPYTVACGIERGGMFLTELEEDVIRDKKILDIAEKVKVVTDPDIDEKALAPVRMEIKLDGGKVYSAEVEHFKGHPKNPLSGDECETKFRKCATYAGRRIPDDNLTRVIELIDKIEEVEDVSEINTLMSNF